jgi:hypothetical protein
MPSLLAENVIDLKEYKEKKDRESQRDRDIRYIENEYSFWDEHFTALGELK